MRDLTHPTQARAPSARLPLLGAVWAVILILAPYALTACSSDDLLAPEAEASVAPAAGRAASPAEPTADPAVAVSLDESALVKDAVEDLLVRVLPALDDQAAAAELRAALDGLAEQVSAGERQQLRAPTLSVRAALERYAGAAGVTSANAADLEVIRLVLDGIETLVLRAGEASAASARHQ